MRQQTFRVVSEAIIIFISAILGTFAWNHGSFIFNSYNPLLWLKGVLVDIGNYPQAWIAFAVFLGILVWILYLRAKSESDAESKLIEKIAKKLDIEAEDTVRPKARKGKKNGRHR